MSQCGEDPFVDNPFSDTRTSRTSSTVSNTSSSANLFLMDSDAESMATPHASVQNGSNAPGEESSLKTNPTFIQDQVNIQRSPSAIKGHASALSRQLSIKSNNSGDVAQSALAGVLTSTPENQRRDFRGREHPERDDTLEGLAQATNKCSLSKSSSERSSKSVRSMQAIGTQAYGTLRVHSPSPTRTPNIKGSELLKSGDIVVVRDLPVNVIFGYDTISFTVKQLEVFEGIKNLPPGAHLIWAGNSDGSLRTGFWLMSCKLASDQYGDVIVKKWDNYHEILGPEISRAEIRIQESNLPEFADKLQSYATKEGEGLDANIWVRMTCCMKAVFLNKVTGQNEWNNWQVSSSHDLKQFNSLHGDNARDFGKDEVLDFVFPKDDITFSSGAIGRERTEQAMDTSAHIMAIITGFCSYEDPDEIIGELQFCYLTGMVLGNLACMEHWAHIIRVTFRAFRLVMDLPVFWQKFIKTVHAQLAYDGVGIEGTIFDVNSNLEHEFKNLLIVFKSRLDEQLLKASTRLTADQKAVGDAFADLESFLWKWRGGWDLRGNFVRSGQIQLEDGEFVDVESKDFEAEDERGGSKKEKRRHHSRTSVNWAF